MIRPKKIDQKKLCPRCGTPMSKRDDGVRYCPVCHYTDLSQKIEVNIKLEETEVKKELPKIEIYQVSASGVNKVSKLDSKFSYLVADRNSNTIWVWKGTQSSPGDAYKASVESTRLKSSLRLYSASIVRVEEGEEPVTFPKIGTEFEAMERTRLEKEEGGLRQQDEMRKRKEEEELRRKEEAMRQKEEESRRRQEEERKRQMEAERKRKEEEGLRLKEEEERKLREMEDQKRQMETERKRMEEEQFRLKEEGASKLKEEENRRRQVEAERKRMEEDQHRLKEEEAAKRKMEEQRRLREDEDRRRQMDAERKRKEDEQRRLKEEEAAKRKAEEERRLREEKNRISREKPVSAIELLEKPLIEAKPVLEAEEEGDISKNPELKEAISSLTLIRGVSKEIAIKLFKVNISTIMELSLSDPENLTASGLSLDTLKQIIRNAKDLLGLD